VLHVYLEEEMQRAFVRDELVSVTVGFGGVAENEATGKLVQAVGHATMRRSLGASRRPAQSAARAGLSAAASGQYAPPREQ
jgi:hypothetical protein